MIDFYGMVCECDSVRIISSICCTLLEPVPSYSANALKIGSVEAAALLYDAAEAYDRRSSKAQQLVRQLRDEQLLPKAVDECVRAMPSIVNV